MKWIIKETWFSREIEFRIDRYGIYLLAFEWGYYQDYDGRFYPVLDRDLKAGISYQYPLWLIRLLHRQRDFNPHVASNHFSFFVWE